MKKPGVNNCSQTTALMHNVGITTRPARQVTENHFMLRLELENIVAKQ